MNAGKLLTAVLLGAAAGATLGILFAPDKGSETRKKISDKGSDLKDKFRKKMNALVDPEVIDAFVRWEWYTQFPTSLWERCSPPKQPLFRW